MFPRSNLLGVLLTNLKEHCLIFLVIEATSTSVHQTQQSMVTLPLVFNMEVNAGQDRRLTGLLICMEGRRFVGTDTVEIGLKMFI